MMGPRAQCFRPKLIVAALFLLFELSSQSSDSDADTPYALRWKRANCGTNQFRCGSGECIARSLICNGEKDCKDRSDETSETCINVIVPALASYLQPPLVSFATKCPSNSFQCRNGVCISQKAKCNGRTDCSDGSDETGCLAGISAPGSGGCNLPKPPANGEYQMDCPSPPCSNGQLVQKLTTLTFKCNSGYTISGPEFLWCDKQWSSPIPTCISELCPPLLFTSRDIECKVKNENFDCNNGAPPGTRAVVRCSAEYTHDPEFLEFETECLLNGQWRRQITPCFPKCGIPNEKGLPFIANGVPAKRGEFPWHVGIYWKKSTGSMEQICGGSIVSPYSIVTAAHCFWNEATSKLVDLSNYKVIAGKHFLDWNVRADRNYTQELSISRVEMPDRFKGPVRSYAHDIAVVVVNEEIHMTKAVRPVCMDYQQKYTNHFTPGTLGIVVGWGITEKNTQSEVLQTARLPYVSFSVCQEEVPPSFQPFLTFDKFCAGYRNGTSVCRGDSGGGYATEFQDHRWYLMGVVSVGVPTTSDDCNIFQYTTFTKTSTYYEFIRKSVV